MIKHYQKFEYGNIKIEANYDGESTPCKTIKFTIDGKEAVIDSHDLYGLLMLYADDEQMQEAVKVTEKQVKMIRKAVKVMANKDIKKGEDVVFIIEYPTDADIADKWYEKNKGVAQEEAEKMLS
jgi:hypothetical protein